MSEVTLYRGQEGGVEEAGQEERAVPRECQCRYLERLKVDVRLPGKGNSNPHGARPVHLIITMIKWIRTSRLSIKNSLSLSDEAGQEERAVPHKCKCRHLCGYLGSEGT